MIRSATVADAEPIADIYNHYVSDTTVTFEEAPVEPAEMAARIESVLSKELPWLVYEDAGEVLGYAYASPWSPRSAYRYTVEASAYLAPTAVGRGVGSALFGALFDGLRAAGIKVVLSRIALPNPASVALNEKFGFTKVGHLSEVGMKFGQWLDVGIWQRRL